MAKLLKGEALRRFMGWPKRKLFYKADLWAFLGADPSYYIDDWLKRGFIKRVERGLYTTEGLGESKAVYLSDRQIKELLRHLPSVVCPYQLKVAYNELRGGMFWRKCLTSKWVAKGFLEKIDNNWYRNKVKVKNDELRPDDNA